MGYVISLSKQHKKEERENFPSNDLHNMQASSVSFQWSSEVTGSSALTTELNQPKWVGQKQLIGAMHLFYKDC